MATIIKIKIPQKKEQQLTPLQQKLLKGPVMSDKQYKEYLKLSKG